MPQDATGHLDFSPSYLRCHPDEMQSLPMRGPVALGFLEPHVMDSSLALSEFN